MVLVQQEIARRNPGGRSGRGRAGRSSPAPHEREEVDERGRGCVGRVRLAPLGGAGEEGAAAVVGGGAKNQVWNMKLFKKVQRKRSVTLSSGLGSIFSEGGYLSIKFCQMVTLNLT